MNDDFRENDPLWELLGKAPARQASAAFSRNVIRAIRTQDSTAQEKPFLAGFFRWLVPAGAVAALALILGMALHSPTETSADTVAATDFYETLTFREVAGLDDLVASSAGWMWEDVAP